MIATIAQSGMEILSSFFSLTFVLRARAGPAVPGSQSTPERIEEVDPLRDRIEVAILPRELPL
jgi:hypothetical protein